MVAMRNALVALALVVAPATAQSASSASWFLVAGEAGSGGTSQSFQHALVGTLAAGAPAGRAVSPSYTLLGGFPAAVDAPATGRPWLAAVAPPHGPLLGGTPLVLCGTELALGPAPTVTIGGVAAPVGARTDATIATTLPAQPRPGYQPVVVQGPFGATTLPRGVAVLPLLEFPVAHQANVPLALRYRGAPGDIVVYGVANSAGPVALPIAPFRHGLQLDLATVFVLTAGLVTAADGALDLPLPALPGGFSVHFQALALTQNPGWSPGSFTNAVRL